MRPPRPIRRGDTVLVANYDRAVWRVIAVVDELAHLTKLNSFQRIDYREVPVARLTRAKGFLV